MRLALYAIEQSKPDILIADRATFGFRPDSTSSLARGESGPCIALNAGRAVLLVVIAPILQLFLLTSGAFKDAIGPRASQS